MDRSPKAIEKRLEALADACRAQGLPVTNQRRAVFRALLEDPHHPSPEQVCARVRKTVPRISLATVYKNLEALRKLGFATEVSPLHQTLRYDANTSAHHHLICVRCKKVLDLPLSFVRAQRISSAAAFGFKVLDVQVQFQGLCPECQRK
jgi:Fur family peroxide stress response transcriptional regulator